MTAVSSADDREHIRRVEHDPSEEPLPRTIARAVSAVSTVSETEALEDLPRHVNPEALQEIFGEPASSSENDRACHIHLHIEGVDVTLYPDGNVVLDA